MIEIKLPVKVLDEGCMTCTMLDISSVTKTRLYADEECVSQEIEISCDHLGLCEKIRKRYINK